MDRVGVFVDAGYLFAQGSVALVGVNQPRSLLDLDEAAVVSELGKMAQSICGLPLLRIYWYDGAAIYKGPTVEHARLAQTPDVKLRLGFLNSAGEQKGVDALIVTDIIDLARNGAIADAVLVSGDEDIRIGVQIAQSFGVRVHLLGIHPARASQSMQLLHEADTTTEWDAEIVTRFLSVRTPAPAVPTVSAQAETLVPDDVALTQVVEQFVNAMTADEVEGVAVFWQSQRGVPSEYDGKLLARSRDVLSRDLDPAERRTVRAHFSSLVKRRQVQPA